MEKIAQLSQAIEGLEKQAAELLKDEDHGRSPHAAPLRARLSAALDSVLWHEKWMAANPKPQAPTAPATPATPPAPANN